MNNKYSVACITLVRDKYKINTDGICVVYTADLIRKLDSKSNRTADSIRDSIRTQKNDSQVPSIVVCYFTAVLLHICVLMLCTTLNKLMLLLLLL